MRTYLTLLLILALCTCARAQICFDLTSEGRTLTVSFISAVDYVNRPANTYNSGLFTFSWPEALGEDIIESIATPSDFGWDYDSGAPLARLVNGRYYQKFIFDTRAEEDLRANVPLPVMTITVFNADVATGEFSIDPAPPAEIENGDAAITNVTEGNRYGENGCNTTVAGVVLPLDFLDFTATATGKSALLDWSTGHESNVDRQEVQRINGNTFVTIGTLSAKNGASNDYTFTDQEVAAGKEYVYRIKAVDYDDAFTLSEQRIVRLAPAVQIFPNPVSATLQLNAPATYSATLKNAAGQTVRVLPATTGQSTVDVSQLPTGTYLLSVLDERNTEIANEKVIITH